MQKPQPSRVAGPTRDSYRVSTHQDLSIVYEGSAESLPTRVPDLGPRGMFINTARHFPVGAVLKVAFRLTRSRHEVKARAEVRYCLAGVGIGVEFVDISPQDQRAIEEELSAFNQG